MKKIIYCCDRCGEEIQDIAFSLTCYAELTHKANPLVLLPEIMEQNARQNKNVAGCADRHLCRKCKDEITDGIFIV